MDLIRKYDDVFFAARASGLTDPEAHKKAEEFVAQFQDKTEIRREEVTQ